MVKSSTAFKSKLDLGDMLLRSILDLTGLLNGEIEQILGGFTYDVGILNALSFALS